MVAYRINPIIDLGLSLSDKIFSFLLLLRPCNKFPFSSWVNLRAVAEQSSSHICDQRKNLSHLWVRLFKSQAKKKETHRKKKSKIGSFSAAILLLRIFTIFFIVSLWHILRVFVT